VGAISASHHQSQQQRSPLPIDSEDSVVILEDLDARDIARALEDLDAETLDHAEYTAAGAL